MDVTGRGYMLKLFSSKKLLKPIFVDFKFRTLKIQVTDYTNLLENSVIQVSVFQIFIQFNTV